MTQTQFKHDDPIEEKDNVDIIKIDNEEETLSYNREVYEGDQASNCAFLIRIALKKFLYEGSEGETSRSSWNKKMIPTKKKDEEEAKA